MSRSIYQNNGKPLSQQALYQQKLRQGIYTTPGVPSVGVNSSASDTAALLAASADLTVKPSYERTVAQEAHSAALAAKKDSITAWSRDAADPQASSAASTARIPKTESYDNKYVGIPAYKGDAVYKQASLNSASTMTSRTTPDKLPSRHGLVGTNSSTTLNISKINQVANKNSTKSLNSRFNPELDYRSGLPVKSQQPPTEFLDQSEENLAAEGAAASLKHGAGYTDQVSSQSRTKSFRAIDVVDATLLAAASAKANDRLKSLYLTTPEDFKAQAQTYANALAIAQKNSEERIKNNKIGLVNLGGGLTMAQSELDKLASLIVQPVLNDIDSKATLQRENDKIAKLKQAELTKLHNKSKHEEFAAKVKEKQDIEKAKQERLEANEGKKKDEDAKFVDYQGVRNTEVEEKVAELKALEAKYAEEKEQLINEQKENQDRIDSEEAELIKSRKDELDTTQAEKDEIVKPVLDELKEENTKLDTLVNAKTELVNEVTTAEKLNQEYEAKLAELNEKLESTNADIEKYTKDLEEAHTKLDETSKHVDDLKLASIDKLKGHEDTSKELDGQIADLEKTKEEHLQTKSLQKQQILDQLDDKVKGEHKINEELPEHLRKDINESKIKDTSSLFTVEEKPAIKELPIVDEATKKAEEAPAAPVAAAKVEAKPKPVAKVAKAAPAATSPSATVSPSKSKRIRSKISEFFSAGPPPKPVAPREVKKVVPVSKPVKKTEPAKSEPKPAESVASNADFEDDISIDKSKNQGGLFKEEI